MEKGYNEGRALNGSRGDVYNVSILFYGIFLLWKAILWNILFHVKYIRDDNSY